MRVLNYGFVLLFALLSGYAQCADHGNGISHDAKNLSDWISETEDNQDLPFMIIDKKETRVYIFHADGKLYSSTRALMGTMIGDDITPGVGNKKLVDITFEERTTPAGRFGAYLGFSLTKSELLWIDYESGISLHPVITSNRKERRLQRLAGSNTSEHRITYGCINVSDLFYREHVHQIFEITGGIVYILPEIHSILKVFGPEAERFSQRQ